MQVLHKMMYSQGRNEGGKGDTITRAPNHYGGAEKYQKCHKQFFHYSKFTSKRAQVRTWGCQTCFFPRALSNLVTPLCTVIVKIKFLFDFLVPEILDNTLLKLYELIIPSVQFWGCTMI